MALESYDVCVGLLQSKPKTPEGKHYTISLPNLCVDAAISVEEVSLLAHKKSSPISNILQFYTKCLKCFFTLYFTVPMDRLTKG